jgi:glycosyltransferase involved in cell wall biosynthesis
MKRVLMIAFHFPPYQGSSGTLRTWNFSRYLPEFGWEPLVLTANRRVYGPTPSGPGVIRAPEGVRVFRALALDAARDLSIRGRYPGWCALPDRWSTWALHALWRARWIIRRYRPALIWSTYPIATAHLIGARLQRQSGLPWVADFRDSMTETGYPGDRQQWQAYRRLEQSAVRSASSLVFTTPGTRRMYLKRYPELPEQRTAMITNGYDEESFAALGAAPIAVAADSPRPMVLLHSGVLYPSERDPQPFLAALARMKIAGVVSAATLRVVLRATAHDATIGAMIAHHQVQDLVELAPPIPYQQALAEMLTADGLLLLQAANCNHQIPAKLYEYMRSGRPIFALTDAAGDTAATLRAAGIGGFADLALTQDIEARLSEFLALLRTGQAAAADRAYAQHYSRRDQAAVLAGLFTGLAAG